MKNRQMMMRTRIVLDYNRKPKYKGNLIVICRFLDL